MFELVWHTGRWFIVVSTANKVRVYSLDSQEQE